MLLREFRQTLLLGVLSGTVLIGCAASANPKTPTPAEAQVGPGAVPSSAPAQATRAKLAADGTLHIGSHWVSPEETVASVLSTLGHPPVVDLDVERGVAPDRMATVIESFRTAGLVGLHLRYLDSGLEPARGQNPSPSGVPAAAPGVDVLSESRIPSPKAPPELVPPTSGTPEPVPSGAAAGLTPLGTSAPPSGGSGAPNTAEALPEVVVRSVGLHIGGGPNDESAKAPYKRAVEARFEEFRRCYRLVADPQKGGVFGVDLKIGRDGGRAEVQQPRSAMGSAEFRQCVTKVFARAEFEKPKKGPTMISYSIGFSLGGK